MAQNCAEEAMGECTMNLNLSAPTLPVFLLSVILAIVALLVHYAGVSIPYVGKHVFEVLVIAYAALFAGNILKGI
jgi:hypothetical protein